jgi:HAD superfamily hydrolase (TIGR01450 family)
VTGHGPGDPPGALGKPLTAVYDVALLDLDGVVYLGGTAIPGAAEALHKAMDAGMRLAYVTNNAFRTPSAIAARLAALGVPAASGSAAPEPGNGSGTAGSVITSAQAAATLLAERLPPGARVLVVGGIGLRAAVRERGLRPVSTALDRPAAVVQGYSPDIDYSLLTEGALAVAAGALFVASNADATLPTARGRQPGNGSLAQVIRSATGRDPIVAGKPEPPMHAEAVRRTGAQHPLIVGDRLDTDIEGANRAGTDSLLVLTGVTHPLDAVLAPAPQRPVYLAADLTGLLEPHPPIMEVQREPFRIGKCSAEWVSGPGGERIELKTPDRSSSTDRIDGLRVLCAAAWSRDGVAAEMVSGALGALGMS